MRYAKQRATHPTELHSNAPQCRFIFIRAEDVWHKITTIFFGWGGGCALLCASNICFKRFRLKQEINSI